MSLSEHNIFKPIFSSNIKRIQANPGNSIYDQRCRVSGRAFVLSPARARANEKGLPWMAEFFNPATARNPIGLIDRGLSILNYRYTAKLGRALARVCMWASACCVDLLFYRARPRVVPGEQPESGLIEDYRRWTSINVEGRPVTKNPF